MEKTLKRSSQIYEHVITSFRKQFKDVIKINLIYLNDKNKVFAGEWIDSKGVLNFNGGFAPDVHKTIKFED